MAVVVAGANSGIASVLVNISSVAGRLAVTAQAVDASPKRALECLSENTAQELAPFGVRVERFEQAFGLDIREGDIRTDEQRAAGR